MAQRLRRYFVLPEFRRRGVASKLMHQCIGLLRSMGCDCVRLQSTAEDRPLYESLGFVSTGEMELTLNAVKRSFASLDDSSLCSG
jgi:GNAT superfamily N-acetyltransferase